jgi:hypothetical protein
LLEHKNTDVDVILIPITIDEQKYVISTIDMTLMNFNGLVIDDFEKIYILGYPPMDGMTNTITYPSLEQGI